MHGGWLAMGPGHKAIRDLLEFLPREVSVRRSGGIAGEIGMDAHGSEMLAIGFVTSFFVAWGVVAWLMNWVHRRGFAPFAIYRIVAGFAVLVWALK